MGPTLFLSGHCVFFLAKGMAEGGAVCLNPKKNFQPVWVTGKDKDEVGSRGNTGAIQKHRRAGENSETAKRKIREKRD